MNKMRSGKALAIYARQCSVRRSIWFKMAYCFLPCRVLNKNSVVVLLVLESLVFVSIGGGLRNAIQYTETSLCGPVISDARWVTCNTTV
jgi:hypothetical protein